MDLLELGLLWPLCGGRVIGRGIAWRGVCRGAFLPRSGEPRRIAFLAHARKSNRYIGIVLAAKLGTLPITADSDAERRSQIQAYKTPSHPRLAWRLRNRFVPARGPRPHGRHLAKASPPTQGIAAKSQRRRLRRAAWPTGHSSKKHRRAQPGWRALYFSLNLLRRWIR